MNDHLGGENRARTRTEGMREYWIGVAERNDGRGATISDDHVECFKSTRVWRVGVRPALHFDPI